MAKNCVFRKSANRYPRPVLFTAYSCNSNAMCLLRPQRCFRKDLETRSFQLWYVYAQAFEKQKFPFKSILKRTGNHQAGVSVSKYCATFKVVGCYEKYWFDKELCGQSASDGKCIHLVKTVKQIQRLQRQTSSSIFIQIFFFSSLGFRKRIVI